MSPTDTESEGCSRCDGPGGVVTYANQMLMPLNGRVQCIDFCIGHIVAALNAGSVRTSASCCGHRQMPGRITLEERREMMIFPDDAMPRAAESLVQRLWQSEEQ